MAFFTYSNIFALFFALVLVIVLGKIYLEKKTKIPKVYVWPILIVLGLVLIGFNDALKVVSFIIPYFVILVILGVFVVLILIGMGAPKSQIRPAFTNKNLWFMLKLIGFLILVLGLSVAFGAKLYEKAKTEPTGASVIDFTKTDEKVDVDVNVSPFFSNNFLSWLMVFIILGWVFWFVPKIKG